MEKSSGVDGEARLGYVRRRADPRDGREERAAIEAELREALGPRRVAAATRVLREALDLHGAGAAVRTRRVRPPA